MKKVAFLHRIDLCIHKLAANPLWKMRHNPAPMGYIPAKSCIPLNAQGWTFPHRITHSPDQKPSIHPPRNAGKQPSSTTDAAIPTRTASATGCTSIGLSSTGGIT